MVLAHQICIRKACHITIAIIFLFVAVSIFTLPECEMASNPGQKKDGSSSSNNQHNRGKVVITVGSQYCTGQGQGKI